MGLLDDAKALLGPGMSAAPETADPCEPLKEESERIFKMKDGLIYSLREYNSDILVATQLYDYKLIPIEN